MKKIPSLEREIRRSGRWYHQEESKFGVNSYICVVNNLKVYRAFMRDNGDFVITTIYPYKKETRGMINKITERRKDIDEKLASRLPLGKGNVR